MLEIELNPFTNLETERLQLRQVTETDVPEILIFRSDDAIMQYLDREKCENLEEAQEFIRKVRKAVIDNEGIMWGICLKDSDKLIGTVGLWRMIKEHHRAEIGYTLHPGYWHKGYMNEALAVVLDYGFKELKLHSVEANVNPENQASRKLLERNGFVQEAFFRENYYFQGKFLDSLIFSLIDPATRKN
jgi:ribosomal-protein-alanine N-acetyltransferase